MKLKVRANILNIAKLVIVGLLLIFWVVSSLLFVNHLSFTIVTFQTRNDLQIKNSTVDVDERNVYEGQFTSRDNNLGLIILEIEKYKNPAFGKEGIVAFKLQEKGKNDWGFQKEYSSGLFDSQSEFAFGFPPIPDSKGKIYLFQLSLKGEADNKMKLEANNYIVTGYQYSKSEIRKNKLQAIEFIFNKTLGSFTDTGFVIKSLKYLFPLALFLIGFFGLKNIRIRFKKEHLKILFVGMVLFELLFSKYIRVEGFYVLLALWMLAIAVYEIKSRVSFILGFLLITLWACIIPLGQKSLESNLNVWIYALFVIGFIQLLIEERSNNEKKKP